MQTGEIVFDKYEIVQTIKSTKSVSVCLAKHIYLNSSWIIKKVHLDNPVYVNEIHILKSLHHESIPLITDVIELEDATYIIREYIEGQTLGELVRVKGVMSEVMAIDIVIEICQALEYLHTAFDSPLIYRDIKPDNIVLSKNRRIKLIDFGIARFYQTDKDADTEYLGTRGFAAPEQYGMGQTDVRTDVFGVGILMYFMLTQKNLDRASSRLEPIRFLRRDIRQELEHILVKACEFNPDQRYATIIEFKEALQKIKITNNKVALDSELNRYKDKMIMVEGIKHGIGATHVVSTLVNYVSQCQEKAVIVDLSERQALASLEYTEEADICNGILIWNAVPIINEAVVKHMSHKDIRTCFEQCQWIIVDAGTVTNQISQDICSALNILVTGMATWEMSCLEEYLLKELPGRTSIFVNHGNVTDIELLNQSLKHLYVHNYPSDLSTEHREKTYEAFYHSVFVDWGIDEQCSNAVKVETFFNIEKYKTKFLKNIKSLL